MESSLSELAFSQTVGKVKLKCQAKSSLLASEASMQLRFGCARDHHDTKVELSLPLSHDFAQRSTCEPSDVWNLKELGGSSKDPIVMYVHASQTTLAP
jgi:hypothetical protein